MSIYPPPNWVEELSTFNSSNYEQSVETSSLSTTFLDANYVKYPVAQGEVSFTNTSNTGNMTIQGNLLTNTITGTTTTSTISLFPSITTSIISLGGSLTTGSTLKIGSSTNSNHLGLIDFTGNTINNTVPTTGSIYICNNQTSGGLFIGGGTTRSGTINIGNGVGNTASINVGTGSSIITLSGSTITANSVSLIPSSLTSALDAALSNNLPQNYFINSTNTTTSRTITLPVIPYIGQKITYINRSSTNNNTILVGNTGTQSIQGYGISSATSITVYSLQTVILQWVNSTVNYWVIQYKSNETYLPITPTYSTITAYTSLAQLGYTYTQSFIAATTTSATSYTASMQITATGMTYPIGLYMINASVGLAPVSTAQIIQTLITSYSTTTISTGAINENVERRFPIAVSIPTGFATTSTASGYYSRASNSETTYITLSFTNTFATGGLVPTLSVSITRIA